MHKIQVIINKIKKINNQIIGLDCRKFVEKKTLETKFLISEKEISPKTKLAQLLEANRTLIDDCN